MKMHELGPAYGATTKRKVVGRGIGSGTGKTAGKGQKGHSYGQLPLPRHPWKKPAAN